MNVIDFLRRHPALPVFVVLAVTFSAAWFYLPLSTTVRGLFLVAGFLVSVIAFYATTDRAESRGAIRGSDWTYAKVVTIAAALGICATVWFDARLVPMAGFLALGYSCVAYQLRPGARRAPLLYELAVLFAVPLFAKFLTTGLYFRGGDVLRHVVFVQELLAAGSIDGMSAYGRYPAYHLLVGSVRELFGLATYDAVVLTGVAVYSLLVPVVYLTVEALTDDRTVALGTGVAFTLLLTLKPFVLAFFPQTLAVAMLFVGLYLSARLVAAETATKSRRYAAVVVVLVVAMATTHHLTFFIAAVPVAVLVGLVLLQRRVETGSFRSALSSASNVQEVYAFPLVIAVVVLLTYWVYTPSIFLKRIVGGLATVFLLTTEESGGRTYRFGSGLEIEEIQLAVGWILSADALYYSVLGALFLVGFYELMRNWREYWNWSPLLVTGFVLGGVLLPLPLPIPWTDRIRVVVAVVAVFPLGVAVARVVRGNPRYPRYAVAALVVVAAGTSAAFTAPVARDLETSATNAQQVKIEWSEREYREMQSLSSFLSEHGATTVSGTVPSEVTLRGEGYPGASVGLGLDEGGLRAPGGLLIVNEYWTDHELILGNSEALISDDRFAASTAGRNKVYASDGTFLLWSEDRFTGLFGSEEEDEGEAESRNKTRAIRN